MFAYNAGGVNDRSGEIIAQGANNAAMLQMESMNQLGQNIAQFADAYVQGQERKAKAKGYADFLGMHGETLGINSDWLEEYKKKPVNEQIAMGDMLVNSYLPHAQRMEYANTIMARRAVPVSPGTTGGGGGMGAGGGSSFTF